MAKPRYLNWTYFWIFWLGGLGIFIAIIMSNSNLVTDAASGGIVAHQAAGSAANVDIIQQSWAAAGKMDFAFWSIMADLVFIGLYSIGGILGGRLIWQNGHSPMLKKLGLIIIIAYAVFAFTDYVETICQIIQLSGNQGSDLLASIAAAMNPSKSIAFIIGTISMIAALIWRAFEKRA